MNKIKQNPSAKIALVILFFSFFLTVKTSYAQIIYGPNSSSIGKYYVDTVNQSQLVDNTLTELLKTLDPHSSYIPANELQAANEPLQGNFDGIGIEFNILNDTIHVVAVIEGGPSALAGIHPGDKIITVEGKNFIGNEINNQSVKNTLRGENGTKINLGIARRNQPKLLSFTIERGKIPLRSIDCTYMVNKTTGYIKINRFSASTYDEYLNSFNKLDSQGTDSTKRWLFKQ